MWSMNIVNADLECKLDFHRPATTGRGLFESLMLFVFLNYFHTFAVDTEASGASYTVAVRDGGGSKVHVDGRSP